MKHSPASTDDADLGTDYIVLPRFTCAYGQRRELENLNARCFFWITSLRQHASTPAQHTGRVANIRRHPTSDISKDRSPAPFRTLPVCFHPQSSSRQRDTRAHIILPSRLRGVRVAHKAHAFGFNVRGLSPPNAPHPTTADTSDPATIYGDHLRRPSTTTISMPLTA